MSEDEMARLRLSLRAAIAACAILSATGCWSTQEIDQTMPPYASTSDEARDPASAPTPVAVPEVAEKSAPEEQGFLAKTGHAIATVVLFPFRMIANAVEWIF
ncbi:MAG TPA: hypothetical protein VEU51_06670 [Candidatus Acidoferrales bacterium]|nr:hypothetical protein [Candidatus Acidoferrales bacterium]